MILAKAHLARWEILSDELALSYPEKRANSRRKAPTREMERGEERRRKRNDGDEEDHNNGTQLVTIDKAKSSCFYK